MSAESFNRVAECCLIIREHLGAEVGMPHYYKYFPISNFKVSINDMPFIISEIISTWNSADKYQMLIHASCVVCFVNTVSGSQSFVVMVIFLILHKLSNIWSINKKTLNQWYLTHLSFATMLTTAGTGTVHYNRETFYILDKYHSFWFLFELYNYAVIIEEHVTLVHTSSRIS
jgi:hypothetical protein